MKKLLSILLATSVLLTQGNFGCCASDVNSGKDNAQHETSWQSFYSATGGALTSVKDWFTNTSVYNHNYTQDWASIKSAPSKALGAATNWFLSTPLCFELLRVYNHNYTKDLESAKDWFKGTSVYNHNYTKDLESVKGGLVGARSWVIARWSSLFNSDMRDVADIGADAQTADNVNIGN